MLKISDKIFRQLTISMQNEPNMLCGVRIAEGVVARCFRNINFDFLIVHAQMYKIKKRINGR